MATTWIRRCPILTVDLIVELYDHRHLFLPIFSCRKSVFIQSHIVGTLDLLLPRPSVLGEDAAPLSVVVHFKSQAIYGPSTSFMEDEGKVR